MKCPKCGKVGKYRFLEKTTKTKNGVAPRKSNATKCNSCGYEGNE